MTKAIQARDRAVERTIVGDAAMLESTLRNLYARGVLVTPPARISPVETRSGVLAVRVVVREAAPKTSRMERARLWSLEHEVMSALIRAGAFGLLFASLVLGALLLILAAVRAAVATVAHMAGGGVALVCLGIAIIWLMGSISRGHPCRGLHCPGCKGH